MLVEQYISPALPSVHLYDSIEITLFWMGLLNVHHLPVVQESQYLGMVHYEYLSKHEQSSIEAALAYKPELNEVFVHSSQHVFDAIKLMTEHHISIMPVLGPANRLLLGTIGYPEIIRFASEMANVNEPGEMIVLEVEPNSLVFKELTSIIESNGSKIIHIFTSPLTDDRTMLVHIKVGRSDIDAVLAGLERYNYKIAYTFADSTFSRDSRDHFESLMRFLSI
jgi:acetoin utilization protein AcuB